MKNSTFTKTTMIQTIFVALILVVSSCGFNQQSGDTKGLAEEQNQERFDRQEKDAQFLVNASVINLKQIQLGQLAQQKGTSPQVRELGKMMEDAHTRSQSDLRALANRKSISIPTSPTDDIRDAYKDLYEKSGDEFDKAYADMVVSRNKEAIDTFEKASRDSHDTDIKNWASASLPELRRNRDHSLASQKKFDAVVVQN